MSRFVPSRHGLRFTNQWPDTALFEINVPGLDRRLGIGVGHASAGLCGGMVFTALDAFVVGLPPLQDPQPSPGSPLYRYIVRRLFDSFNLPVGVLRYYTWMLRPDQDWAAGRLTQRGVAGRSAAAWQSVKADLDSGQPCPLGLVTVRSANPLQLGQNHLVLAYGYQQQGPQVTIRVYDPNTDLAEADEVGITVDLRKPWPPAGITHNVNISRPIRGLFRVRYRAADPRALVQSPAP
ncbi:MAG: hypothetical protein M3N98_12575 [Actinomycetota bacterium]|nr:hypothetical protein [Actinomycetota bacterium]